METQSISIVICGEAGQGLKTVESVLTKILKLDGYHVFATKEYMSRVRGGVNTTSILVSSAPGSAYVRRIDILIPLSRGRTEHLTDRINHGTMILGEKENILENCGESECKIAEVAFTAIAEAIGNKIYSNLVAVGVVCGLFQVEPRVIEAFIREYFASKDEKIVNENITAAQQGYEKGKMLLAAGGIKIDFHRDPAVKEQLILSGAEAVGWGALAGGCNFIAAYPMTPSTEVWTFLTQHAKDFGVVTEQAEDEIAAMNMALGAWYAGGRALVNTAGGGFALMVEGLSLAGMLEMPVVIHVGQRPGPATGLPTRTEQGDLSFVLHAGHGEFPRAIFAPGNLAEAFDLTQKAFNLADKYQVPVFILTDQYLMDSYYNSPGLKVAEINASHYFIKTDAKYQRYAMTEDGVSPRGVPGFGEGLVCVDSDEHDAEGHITEDLFLRSEMVDKRLRKLEGLKKEVLEPQLIGNSSYKNLIIGWGATREMIKEALEKMGRSDTAFLHFSQVYPLPSSTARYLEQAERVIMVESNATSQFADLIKLETGFEIEERINKFDGLPFAVEEIGESVEALLEEK